MLKHLHETTIIFIEHQLKHFQLFVNSNKTSSTFVNKE